MGQDCQSVADKEDGGDGSEGLGGMGVGIWGWWKRGTGVGGVTPICRGPLV